MAQRPNIIFFITHDTGRHVGGYGLGAHTPQLDRLAADGVRWRNCFCTAPQCSPSRAGVLSGQLPHVNGMIGLAHRGFRLAEDCPRLPALLAAAGYHTRLLGEHHEAFGHEWRQLGYQAHNPGHRAAEVAESACRFLEHAPSQPFYLNLGTFETHRVFAPTDGPLDDVQVPPYLPDAPETRRDFADFAGELAHVDAALGRLLDTLDATGLADNTLLVWTTDHGVAFPGAKSTLYDPGLAIGAIMRGPGGFRGGRDLDPLIQNIDFLPTFCELAGVDVPASVQGRSLLPLVNGEVESLHEELFVEQTYHAAYDPLRGVRTATHKYIRSFEYRPVWFPPNVDDSLSKRLLADDPRLSTLRPREQLFDLAADPLERVNLAADPAHAEVLADLRARVERCMAETHDPLLAGWVAPPAGAQVTPATNWGAELPYDR